MKPDGVALHDVSKQEVLEKPTFKEFAPRFLERYAKANRLNPSGIAAKRTILHVHLVPAFGDKTLDSITTEDVHQMKAALTERSPKTVNNVLTALSAVLKTPGGRDRTRQLDVCIRLRTAKRSVAACTRET
jgi:hypothetical protein